MNYLLKIVSLIALAGIMVPCLLYFGGVLEHRMVTWIALVSTFIWFGVTPCWMGREIPPDAVEVEI